MSFLRYLNQKTRSVAIEQKNYKNGIGSRLLTELV